jgi:hypothetical protein
MRRGSAFEKVALPAQAQFSSIPKIIAGDFTHDGNMDLLLLGNHNDNRLKLGSFDANYGCLLAGEGTGNFKYVEQTKSGLRIKGDVKSAVLIKVNNTQQLLVGTPDSELQSYTFETTR